MDELLEMGMVVHLNLAKVKSTRGQKQFVETVGGYTVLTTTMNYATDTQATCEKSSGHSGRTGWMHTDRTYLYFCRHLPFISALQVRSSSLR